MFMLRQTSVKMAVLLHKQAKVPFILIIAVCTVKPRNLLILGLSKIVLQIAKSADCECYCM